MFKTLSVKLIVSALVALLATLAWLAHENHVAAVAAAAMEKRQAEAERARRKFEEDFRKAGKENPVTWGGAANAIQNWRLDTSYGPRPEPKGKAK